VEKRLGVTEARDQLSDIVDQVQHKGDAYILSRHGKPAAAVVPIEVYENWRHQRRILFDTVRKIQQANVDIDPEQVFQDVLQAQSATRTAQK